MQVSWMVAWCDKGVPSSSRIGTPWNERQLIDDVLFWVLSHLISCVWWSVLFRICVMNSWTKLESLHLPFKNSFNHDISSRFESPIHPSIIDVSHYQDTIRILPVASRLQVSVNALKWKYVSWLSHSPIHPQPWTGDDSHNQKLELPTEQIMLTTLVLRFKTTHSFSHPHLLLNCN